MCSYCPQKTFTKVYRNSSGCYQMSVETFEKCISTVPNNICLSFSGFSEPWLNPECTKMILMAYEKGYNIRVNTTLIGMSASDIGQFKEIPFIKFVIHLPDNNGLTHIRVDQNYIETASMLLNSNIKNLTWKFHQTTPELKIKTEIADLLMETNSKIEFFGINNRAGNVKNYKNTRSVNSDKLLCKCQDFNHNILLPDGDVVLCHMDWSMKHVLGNLLKDNYQDLYSGESFQKILSGLKDPQSDILCRSCEKDLVNRNFTRNLVHLMTKKIRGEKDLY
jgi:hypothetical protein